MGNSFIMRANFYKAFSKLLKSKGCYCLFPKRCQCKQCENNLCLKSKVLHNEGCYFTFNLSLEASLQQVSQTYLHCVLQQGRLSSFNHFAWVIRHCVLTSVIILFVISLIDNLPFQMCFLGFYHELDLGVYELAQWDFVTGQNLEVSL